MVRLLALLVAKVCGIPVGPVLRWANRAGMDTTELTTAWMSEVLELDTQDKVVIGERANHGSR